MRKTLFALLGLVAIGVGAVPALAGVANNDPPKAFAPIPLENRAGAIGATAKSGTNQATLSGTLIKQANATTSWFLYPGACNDRASNTWAAKTGAGTPIADSLNSYAVGSLGGYGRGDQSLAPKLTHITSVSGTPASQRPAGFGSDKFIWMGKYDPNWVVFVGYPNLTQQIIYIDLGTSGGTLTMNVNASSEQNYDFIYYIGGGVDEEDPLGNSRGDFDAIRATGVSGDAHLRATLTGSLNAGNASTVNGAANPTIVGDGAAEPSSFVQTVTIPAGDRAFYILFLADCLFSHEDGLWPFGTGVSFDNISIGATSLFAEQSAAGGTDAVGGDILVAAPIAGIETDGVVISARVFPGVGELWSLQQASAFSTADICVSKARTDDNFFLGTPPLSPNALPGQFNSVVSCTFPVPVGTADIIALWGEYLNLPRTSGYVQYSEYRFYRFGTWSNWENTAAGGGVRTSVIDQWVIDGDPLANAVQADSFQVRYNIQCIDAFAANRACNTNTLYAVLYDDLFLQVTTGVPAPVFGIFVGSVAQTTFVDGTMTGLNCAAAPCWPGIRGSDLQTNPNPDIAASAVKDNLNSPLGDSLTMAFVTGLRKSGMGINWQFGYDRTVGGGLTPLARTNGAYNTSFDTPRVIYRLYDPATNLWSPWDSTATDANNVSVSGDTVVIDSEYRLNWPPRDKAGLNLPGGFTINGQGAYNNLGFLPRGTRLQYYFKAVDINGGISYQFSTDALAREVADLPTLPGSANIAPDIVEFDVLPRRYAVGASGSLLAGKTDTPLLNLDGNYSGWSFGQDPVTAALRGMGVRADRYRFLQGLGEGHNVGGHELTGDRPARLSNYFPNMEEYGIKDSLATWYRIIIQSSHLRTPTVFDESDAQVINDWAVTSTGSNGGDRCILFTGDDGFNAMLNVAAGVEGSRQLNFSTNIFGVANVTTQASSAAKGAWAGAGSTPYPTNDDRFAAQASGPGLAAAGTFTYEVDGGCPGPNRFDPLTPTGGAVASATFPLAASVVDNSALAKATEFDGIADLDQTKSLAYGHSIQYVRGAPGAIPRTAANYVRSGVQNRMQILYKFLTGCRGARGSGDLCWPCPADANMLGNWNAGAGFNTATYGPLYPIQDHTTATGIGPDQVSEAPKVNRIFGNSPNPFNPLTKINFAAATAGKVTIRIYNVAGQLVRTLETKVEKAGPAFVHWDGRSDRGLGSGSGVYFYKATFANGVTLSANKSMVLVK